MADSSLKPTGSAAADTAGATRSAPPATRSASAPETVSHHPAVRYNPDAPSEEWGWHGHWRVFAPRGSTILLSLGVILLFLLNFTEHVSRVEDYYFNGIALIGAIWVIYRIRSGRKLRRRVAQRRDDH